MKLLLRTYCLVGQLIEIKYDETTGLVYSYTVCMEFHELCACSSLTHWFELVCHHKY